MAVGTTAGRVVVRLEWGANEGLNQTDAKSMAEWKIKSPGQIIKGSANISFTPGKQAIKNGSFLKLFSQGVVIKVN